MPRVPSGDDADDLLSDNRPFRRRARRDRWDDVRHPQRPPHLPDDDPGVPAGARRSTYPDARHGPSPPPSWVVTTGAALDVERGVVKTGKEADVDLVERVDTATGRRALMAAKRYRTAEHRMFHRDAGYLEGRRVRKSRETRAMATRTAFGRDLIAGQWAATEFDLLGRLWLDGVAVPYPVSLDGRELLLEFIGDDDGVAAPRLAELRPDARELDSLWQQCREALGRLADAGFTHGDLSAYNVLVHAGRLVLIDVPQAVDVVGNPQGFAYLRRDCEVITRWFAARGHPEADAGALEDELLAHLGA